MRMLLRALLSSCGCLAVPAFLLRKVNLLVRHDKAKSADLLFCSCCVLWVRVSYLVYSYSHCCLKCCLSCRTEEAIVLLAAVSPFLLRLLVLCKLSSTFCFVPIPLRPGRSEKGSRQTKFINLGLYAFVLPTSSLINLLITHIF